MNNNNKINPDELFEIMTSSMTSAGLNSIDRKTFDRILEFNELCMRLVDLNNGDYEFPFVYLTGKMFNRLTEEGKVSLLKNLEKELDEWNR